MFHQPSAADERPTALEKYINDKGNSVDNLARRGKK